MLPEHEKPEKTNHCYVIASETLANGKVPHWVSALKFAKLKLAYIPLESLGVMVMGRWLLDLTGAYLP